MAVKPFDLARAKQQKRAMENIHMTDNIAYRALCIIIDRERKKQEK